MASECGDTAHVSEAPGRLTIVGLGGSLRAASHSRAALEVALAGAEEAGAETRLLDLRELALPMFDPEDRKSVV